MFVKQNIHKDLLGLNSLFAYAFQLRVVTLLLRYLGLYLTTVWRPIMWVGLRFPPSFPRLFTLCPSFFVPCYPTTPTGHFQSYCLCWLCLSVCVCVHRICIRRRALPSQAELSASDENASLCSVHCGWWHLTRVTPFLAETLG